MVMRNKNLAKLQAGYLFPEITRRKNEFLSANPGVDLISLGIGDTAGPLIPVITDALVKASEAMGTNDGYYGYGDERGIPELRSAIVDTWYKGLIEADDIFVNDGAKPDTGRLQVLFGNEAHLAVQDPSYPVYVDSAVILGQTGEYDSGSEGFDEITYMPCTVENEFFPDYTKVPHGSLIFFCSPNNPTGAVANHDQLRDLVSFAKLNKSIIIFDAAYSRFIQDSNLPRSIYEIEGAKEVAIEVNSFSKPFGFTGLRLGWTIVPKELKFEDGSPVAKDYSRIITTIFNGASIIVQKGALAAFTDSGLQQMQDQISLTMENARIIKTALNNLGYSTYGGVNAPYIWTKIEGMNSWEAFDRVMEEANIVCTPGSGFGPSGEGFIRFSAFGKRQSVLEAVVRLKDLM